MKPAEIRRALKTCRLTETDLAEMLGVSVWTVRAYLRTGEHSRPAPASFRTRLMQALRQHAQNIEAYVEQNER